jgi:SAM-dependent methyltransferase
MIGKLRSVTAFEFRYELVRSLLPPLYSHVRRLVIEESKRQGHCLNLLDVGGRKSHYTIGLHADVTISDIPRQSEVQKALNLGITDEILLQTQRRRSNIKEIVYDDMTRSVLPDGAFDVILSVEVLEHVEEDASFVKNVHRVLKPGGLFIMTTPNGDFVANTNPDHKRHYRREQLQQLLRASFRDAEVYYGIRGGRFRKLGLKSWSPRRPVQTLLSMLGNVVNGIQSANGALAESSSGTHHLFARCRKES